MKSLFDLLFGKNKKIELKLISLHNLLNNSFGNVKKDISSVSQWLNYLYHKNLQQEDLINKLHNKIEELRNSHLQLHKSHYELHQKHRELVPKIEALKSEITVKSHSAIQPQINHSQALEGLNRRLQKIEAKKSKIKEKVIKRITKNSKDYIKSIILSYLKKYSKISALQLKEIIVEEQGLCSKSSFYRILDELEQDPAIGIIQQGKEKHYLLKLMKTKSD